MLITPFLRTSGSLSYFDFEIREFGSFDSCFLHGHDVEALWLISWSTTVDSSHEGFLGQGLLAATWHELFMFAFCSETWVTWSPKEGPGSQVVQANLGMGVS